MTITRKYAHDRLEDHFPGVSLTRRSLIFIIGTLDLRIDTLANNSATIKGIIANHPMFLQNINPSSDFMARIVAYLREPKFNTDELDKFKMTPIREWMIEGLLPEVASRGALHLWGYNQGAVSTFSPKDKFIYYLDKSPKDENSKKMIMNEIIEIILQTEQNFSYLKWVSSEDEAGRTQAAHDFLSKNGDPKPAIFQNADDVKKYFISNSKGDAESKLLFRNIRAFYATRKSRQRTSKVQRNFVVSKKAAARIKSISNKYGITQSEVINEFFEHKEYSDFDLRFLRSSPI